LLVLLEIFVLLGGVIARYAFHNPIIWSDELASTLFLWLAMLGSAIALHRADMRMTAFVGMLSPPKRLALDAVATVAALTFLLLILPSAHEFAMDEIAVTTPAMQISDAWRAAALPTGFAIMVLIGFVRLFEVGNWRDIAGATCASLVLAGGCSSDGLSFLPTIMPPRTRKSRRGGLTRAKSRPSFRPSNGAAPNALPPTAAPGSAW
jgi:TRAP-type C4-dicarboxylate transport system permease small subunit